MDRLPTELLSQIFACFDEREAAKAKRVCKAFDEHIRHRYPRRIVFARNEVSLRDISNIINIPYLRDSVTELVFDASRSNHHEIESGLEGYAERCEHHHYGRNLFGGQRSSQADSESDGTEDEYDSYSRAPSFISHHSDFKGSKAEKKKSFWAYLERYQEEERIINEGRDWAIISQSLKTLTSLRTIRFTDFRGTAHSGWSYTKLLDERFGDVLHPEGLESDGGDTKHFHYADFGKLIRLVGSTPSANIEHIAISRHMFENQSPMGSQKFLEGFFSPHSTPISSFNVQGPELEEIRKAFIALRSLRLPFHFFTQYESLGMHGQMLPRLLVDAVNITHLMVSLTKYDEIGELGKYPYEGREEEVEAEFEREPRSNFQILFQTLHLPNLVQLDLRGWKCSSQEIRTLLERHSATLRELRLYDMYLIKGQWYSLARRLGRKLMLTGVDLHSLGRALETPLHYFNEPDETGEIYHEPEIDICISGERIKASLTTILNHRYYPTQLLLHGRRNRMKRERDEAQNFNVEEDRQEEIYSWRDKPRFW